MYEFFEHTADLGLRVNSADLDTLFREAAEGLFAMIAEGVDPGPATRELEYRIDGTRHDYLLFDWLNELLYTFESEKLLLGRFEVRVEGNGLRATAFGQPLDPARHRLLHEVKAITYHQLKVERAGAGWRAEVIVDI